jgi:hypothetical protein
MAASDDPLIGFHVSVTPEEANELLEKLLDDDFRERLESDPRGVLAEYHIEIPEGYFGEEPVTLPTPDEIREARELTELSQFDEAAGRFRRFAPIFGIIMRFAPFRPPGPLPP